MCMRLFAFIKKIIFAEANVLKESYMKRLLILTAIFLFTSLTINAQEYKYEARLGWFLLDGHYLVEMTARVDPALGHTRGPLKTTGIFSADFDFKIKKWLIVGANVGYRNYWRHITPYEGTPWTYIDHNLIIMPTVKFSTGFDSFFRYYATLAFGAGLRMSSGKDNIRNHEFYPSFQITPVGIAVGRKVSWFFEVGYGVAFAGFITGISCRF